MDLYEIRIVRSLGINFLLSLLPTRWMCKTVERRRHMCHNRAVKFGVN